MREITLNEMVFKVHGVTKKMFRDSKLEEHGFGVHIINEKVEGKTPGQCVDKFIETSLNSVKLERLDDLTPKDTVSLYKACIAETYGSMEEEKNSQVSGTGSPETEKK